MIRISLLSILIVFNTFIYGQSDSSSVKKDSAVDSTAALLPKDMMLTQRMLWGEKGLMRQSKSFHLTEEGRDRELNIRNNMITAHRYLGYATLLGLASECVVGILLYNGKDVSGLHGGLAGVTNILYFTTAGLAFFSPPRAKERESGWSNAKLHKTLAVVHLTGMIATNVLGGMSENNSDLAKYHRVAAIATFGSYLAATVVVNL